jgi:hypothetical protein
MKDSTTIFNDQQLRKSGKNNKKVRRKLVKIFFIKIIDAGQTCFMYQSNQTFVELYLQYL